MNKLDMHIIICAAVLLLVTPTIHVAYAQEAPKKVYTPKPLAKLTIGGKAGLGYQDNVFRGERNKISDAYFSIAPAMRLRTYYDDFDLTGTLSAESVTYFEQDQSNYLDLDLRMRGVYHIDEYTDFIAKTRLRKDHVDIGAFDDDPNVLADEPSDYRSAELEAGIDSQFTHWRGYAAFDVMVINYDNVSRVGNGELIVNDDRDRRHAGIRLRADTPIDAYYGAFSSVYLNRRDYNQQIDSTVVNPRDSEGVEWLAGITFGERKVNALYGELGVGLLLQSYEDPLYPDVDTYALRGDARWHPDDSSELRFEVRREVGEVTTRASSSYVMSLLRLRAKHQFDEDWQLGAMAMFRRNDFQVNPLEDVGRIDDIHQLEAFAEYAVHEKVNLGLSLQRQERISNKENTDYIRNIVMLYISAPY